MLLSPNFSLEELVKSQTAIRKGINNTPNAEQIENLKLLCTHVLEDIHASLGPISINSGFRCPELNEAIGGAATSQHCLGQAADIELPGTANAVLANWIAAKCDYDQLILECYTSGQPTSGWVHVSYKPSGNRKEKLTATMVNGKMRYLPGINP